MIARAVWLRHIDGCTHVDGVNVLTYYEITNEKQRNDPSLLAQAKDGIAMIVSEVETASSLSLGGCGSMTVCVSKYQNECTGDVPGSDDRSRFYRS